MRNLVGGFKAFNINEREVRSCATTLSCHDPLSKKKMENAFAWKAFQLCLVHGKVEHMLTCHLKLRWRLPVGFDLGKTPNQGKTYTKKQGEFQHWKKTWSLQLMTRRCMNKTVLVITHHRVLVARNQISPIDN